MTKTVYIMVGLPCSGKSTYISRVFPNAVVVSSDNIIDRIAAEEGKTYSEVWQSNAKRADKEHWQDFLDALKAGKKEIVVDRTNMMIKSRARYMIAHDSDYDVVAIEFALPSNESEKAQLAKRNSDRAAKTGKVIPTFVIAQMTGSYQAPTLDEGFERIETIKTWT